MEKYNLDDKGGMFRFLGKSPVKIVKNGEPIEFKHASNHTMAKAVVLDVSEHSLKVQLKDRIASEGIAVEDHIVLNYNPSSDFMVITGEVGSIDRTDPLEITVKVVKIEKLKDLIKEKKCCVGLQGTFKIIGIADGKPVTVKAISLGGIKANCREDIMMEDVVDIMIQVDKINKMNFKGRVVRKNRVGNNNEYGIEYTDIGESTLKHVHHLLYQYESMV